MVDVARLRQLLHGALALQEQALSQSQQSVTPSVTPLGQSEAITSRALVLQAAQWAAEYNAYTAALCARAHVCVSWGTLVEVSALSLASLPPTGDGPSRLAALLGGALALLEANPNAEPQLWVSQYLSV